MFGEAKLFTGFIEGCQKKSVSPLLLDLVNIILDGPTITHCYEEATPAVLSISQLLKVNSIKHRRKESTTEAVSVCHSAPQETPVPTYVTLMLRDHRHWHLSLSLNNLCVILKD